MKSASTNLIEIMNVSFTKPQQNELKKFTVDWEFQIKNGYIFSELDAINIVLRSMSDESILLLKKKFEDVCDYYQMHDIFAELRVMTKYMDHNPILVRSKNNEQTPDIYLEKTREYIEVKSINTSDESHGFENFISLYSLHSLPACGEAIPITKSQAMVEVIPKIINKAKDKIDKANKQLLNKHGFVYLFCRIDTNTDRFGRDNNGLFYKLPIYVEEKVERLIEEYAHDKGVKIIIDFSPMIHHIKQ